MNLRLRGARPRDIAWIDKQVSAFKFNLDIKHIQTIIVVEDLDTGNLIAAGSLVTILESMFVTDKTQPRKSRVEALKMMVECADKETATAEYDSYHAFATNDEIVKVLERKFKFQPTNAKVMVRIL